jgi:Relaxase/Mobilisation nuclease domain
MILSFSKHSTGPGKAPVRYVCGAEKTDATTQKKIKRASAPEIMRGDALVTEKLIDSIDFKHKYTSLVISFTQEEFSKELAQQVLDEFEKAAFAGLDSSQYDYLAVLHTDTANPHIHVISPRVELSSKKSYNLAPPGSASGFWTDWSTVTREKFNLKQIESNALDKSILNKFEKQLLNKNRLSALPISQAKFEIDQNIKENILNGLLTNRSDVIDYLKKSGFEISRITANSISLKTNTKNIRMEGLIYGESTSRDKKSYAEIAAATSSNQCGNRVDHQRKLEAVKARFKASLKLKFNFNTNKYRSREQEDRGSHKKLLSYNAPATQRNELLAANDKQSSINNQSSAHAQIKPAPTPEKLGGGGGSISAQIANIRAKISGSQNHEERENLRQILLELISQENEEQYRHQKKFN